MAMHPMPATGLGAPVRLKPHFARQNAGAPGSV